MVLCVCDGGALENVDEGESACERDSALENVDEGESACDRDSAHASPADLL